MRKSTNLPGVLKEPPAQHCRYCGAPITLTRESLARFQKAGAEVQARGFFYSCECSDDLQPMSAPTYESLRSH